MTERGWWKLEITGIESPISDITLEHIANLIKAGCKQGEVIEECEKKNQ